MPRARTRFLAFVLGLVVASGCSSSGDGAPQEAADASAEAADATRPGVEDARGAESGVDSGTGTATNTGTDAGMDMGAMDADADEACVMPTPEAGVVHVGACESYTFQPWSITIHAGESVTWIFDDDFHTVTSGTVSFGIGTPDGKFCFPSDTDCVNAPAADVGDRYVHRFDAAGTYPYFCKPHAPLGMTGQVVVLP